MKIKTLILGVCLLLIFSFILTAKETAIVLKQENAPIVIVKYSPGWSFHPGEEEDFVKHEVEVKNVSEKKVVALKFKFIAWNVFNEFLGEMWSYKIPDFSVNPGKKKDFTGRQMCDEPVSFLKYGTGVTHISKVRFEDGTIWEADEDSILRQLEEVRNIIEKK